MKSNIYNGFLITFWICLPNIIAKYYQLHDEYSIQEWYDRWDDDTFVATRSANSFPSNDSIIIGILSKSIEGFRYRETLRKTILSQSTLSSHQVHFLLLADEQTEKIPSIQWKQWLQKENESFQDFQFHWMDKFRSPSNTLEIIMSFFLSLQSSTCSSKRFNYFLLIEDDTYIHFPSFFQLMSNFQSNTPLYAGKIVQTQKKHDNSDLIRTYPFTEILAHVSTFPLLLSLDLVEYLVSNHLELKAVSPENWGLSLSFWFWGLQVFPKHIDEFANLFPCQANLISFSGLSTIGIHEMYWNQKFSHLLCDGFGKDWLKNNNSVEEEYYPAIALRIRLPKKLEDKEFKTIRLLYQPRKDNRLLLLDQFCQYYGLSYAICVYIDDQLVIKPKQKLSLHSRLFYHNINVYPSTRSLTIHYVYISPMATYSLSLIESLLVDLFPSNMILIHSINNIPSIDHDQMPKLFIFSVLDGGCHSSYDINCQQQTQQYLKMYPNIPIIMFHGESWYLDMNNIPSRVILLTSNYTMSINRINTFYVPVMSTSFAERRDTLPSVLLTSSFSIDRSIYNRTKFCAYLYTRCDRIIREQFYDALTALKPVDALGICHGFSPPSLSTSAEQIKSKLASRHRQWYQDEAVEMYRSYRFVIAFENDVQPKGYVTEKIVNAFLANAIPIYYGTSFINQVFDAHTFINCNNFETLQACAEYVIKIDNCEECFNQYLQHPPLEYDTYQQIFSWHPDVKNSSLNEKLKKLLNLNVS